MIPLCLYLKVFQTSRTRRSKYMVSLRLGQNISHCMQCSRVTWRKRKETFFRHFWFFKAPTRASDQIRKWRKYQQNHEYLWKEIRKALELYEASTWFTVLLLRKLIQVSPWISRISLWGCSSTSFSSMLSLKQVDSYSARSCDISSKFLLLRSKARISFHSGMSAIHDDYMKMKRDFFPSRVVHSRLLIAHWGSSFKAATSLSCSARLILTISKRSICTSRHAAERLLLGLLTFSFQNDTGRYAAIFFPFKTDGWRCSSKYFRNIV